MILMASNIGPIDERRDSRDTEASLVFWWHSWIQLYILPSQIRIRDPNQGGRDITEEIMSGGRSTSTPTPPQVSPTLHAIMNSPYGCTVYLDRMCLQDLGDFVRGIYSCTISGGMRIQVTYGGKTSTSSKRWPWRSSTLSSQMPCAANRRWCHRGHQRVFWVIDLEPMSV